MPKKALITGITGQDGSYLSEFLLGKGYEVHGLIRRASTFNTERLDAVYQDPHNSQAHLFLHYGDLADSVSTYKLIDSLKPDEVYHLGAQSHVRVSFDVPEYTADITGTGTVRLLEAIRQASPHSPFLPGQFLGDVRPGAGACRRRRPRRSIPAARTAAPRCSPTGWWSTTARATTCTRATASCSTTRSPRRGETFVTRKITRAVARIKAGVQEKLYLGNLDSKRDWGYAPEYVEAMWLMLQQDKPDDYVIATNETHTIREFLEVSFGRVGLDYEKYVEIDPRYFRPAEVDLLIGDPAKAKKQLGWAPEDDVQGVGGDHDRRRRGPARSTK